jgi:hypothetical protein
MPLAEGRDYIVTHPDGHEETIRGLSAFCLKFGLAQGALTRVARGQAHHHKGFRIRYALEPLAAMPGRARLSLTYVITHPGGREEAVTGLPVFCTEHGLAAGHMTLVAQGKRSHHKGYGCRYGDRDIASRYPTRSHRVRVRLHDPVKCAVKMVQCEVCGKNFETRFKHAKYCPDCREGAALARAKEYAKIRYTKNKDRILANHKAYLAANKASVKAGRRKYYLENKEEVAASRRKYYLENKEEVAASRRKYYREKKVAAAAGGQGRK